MVIRDVMTRQVVTVSPQTSVLNARRLLAAHRIRHLPVVVGDEVVGMISDRDIRVGDATLESSLRTLQSDLLAGRYRRVDTVMSAPPHVVAPDDSVAVAAELMASRRIGAVPVVEDGRLVGIVGLTDCVRTLLDSTAVTHHDLASHGDVDALRLDAGDPRPGRPDVRVQALVVEPDPATRLQLRNELTTIGYDVTTCAGPTGGVTCPAVAGAHARCPRVPAETALIVIDDEVARTPVRDAYERWLPLATVRVPRRPSLSPG